MSNWTGNLKGLYHGGESTSADLQQLFLPVSICGYEPASIGPQLALRNAINMPTVFCRMLAYFTSSLIPPFTAATFRRHRVCLGLSGCFGTVWLPDGGAVTQRPLLLARGSQSGRSPSLIWRVSRFNCLHAEPYQAMSRAWR